MKEFDKQRERQLRSLILSKGEDYGGETFTDFYNQVKAIFMPPISNEVGKESRLFGKRREICQLLQGLTAKCIVLYG